MAGQVQPQCLGRIIPVLRRRERPVAVRVTHVRAKVMAVQLEQLVADYLPKPEE